MTRDSDRAPFFSPSGEWRVPLSKGMTAVIDADDVELVRPYSWHAKVNGKGTHPYAGAYMTVNGRRIQVQMHRHLTPPPVGFEIDHINGDSLDNRRSNLRFATHAQNVRNRGMDRRNKSGHTGVAFNQKIGLWTATIRLDWKPRWLGSFSTIDEAIAARRRAEDSLFGEFANRLDR